jgi:hypothetical protein
VDLISSQLDCCFAAEKHTYMLAAYASYCMTLDFMDLPALILINVPSIGLTTEKYFSACACDQKKFLLNSNPIYNKNRLKDAIGLHAFF